MGSGVAANRQLSNLPPFFENGEPIRELHGDFIPGGIICNPLCHRFHATGIAACPLYQFCALDPCASRNFFPRNAYFLRRRSVTMDREQRVGIYQKNSYVNDSAKELI
jgi:hypothetical protein